MAVLGLELAGAHLSNVTRCHLRWEAPCHADVLVQGLCGHPVWRAVAGCNEHGCCYPRVSHVISWPFMTVPVSRGCVWVRSCMGAW